MELEFKPLFDNRNTHISKDFKKRLNKCEKAERIHKMTLRAKQSAKDTAMEEEQGESWEKIDINARKA